MSNSPDFETVQNTALPHVQAYTGSKYQLVINFVHKSFPSQTPVSKPTFTQTFAGGCQSSISFIFFSTSFPVNFLFNPVPAIFWRTLKYRVVSYRLQNAVDSGVNSTKVNRKPAYSLSVVRNFGDSLDEWVDTLRGKQTERDHWDRGGFMCEVDESAKVADEF